MTINDTILTIRRTNVALLVMFFVGFASIVGISLAFQRMIDHIDEQHSNERARLFVGEQIVISIFESERLFYQLSTTTGSAAQQRILHGIASNADQLEAYLRVIQHGGQAKQKLLLNLYPPGTLVRLNNDSLGLVVSPGKDTLRPTVLVYTPEVKKQDAPTVDLSVALELKIEEAIKPSALPHDVVLWMSPRQRLSYYFSADKK